MYNLDQNTEPLNFSSQNRFMLLKQQKAELQIEVMKLREELEIIKNAYAQQNEGLKLQLKRKDQFIAQLQDSLDELKKQIKQDQGSTMKCIQDYQRQKRMMEKLKMDNEALQIEVQKYKNERRVYCNKLEEIKYNKNDLMQKMIDRQRVCQQTLQQKKHIERKLQEYKLTLQDLSQQAQEKQNKNAQLSQQLKKLLQSQLSATGQVNALQQKVTQLKVMNQKLKEDNTDLIRLKQQLQMKLSEYEEDRGSVSSSSSITAATQNTMIQIQSFMKQINRMLDDKKQKDSIQNKYRKDFRVSMKCLQKLLR